MVVVCINGNEGEVGWMGGGGEDFDGRDGVE